MRNAQEDGAAYNTPRTNLTFFAATTASTLGGSAITTMERFDGSPAASGIATEILPTGGASQVDGQVLPNRADVLQVLSESEASAVSAPAGVGVFPYGFVVRNASNAGRTLPAGPALGQYDGLVTFAFKIPLQSTAAADPFTVSVMFLAEDDSETRITQSLEEQTTSGEAAFVARAAAIGATTKTVLPGSGYLGEVGATRTVCTVRTAGSSSSPTTYLVDRRVASVALVDPFAGWPLLANGGTARQFSAVAHDGGGAPLADVPVQVSFGTAGVLTVMSGTQSGNKRVRMLTRRDRASTTMSASTCGFTSAPVTLKTSGYSSIAGGYVHSLAIRSNGTVVGWGQQWQGRDKCATNAHGRGADRRGRQTLPDLEERRQRGCLGQRERQSGDYPSGAGRHCALSQRVKSIACARRAPS